MVVGDGFGRSGSERPLAGQVEGLHWPCLSLDTVFKRGLQYRFDLLISYPIPYLQYTPCHHLSNAHLWFHRGLGRVGGGMERGMPSGKSVLLIDPSGPVQASMNSTQQIAPGPFLCLGQCV